MRLQGLILPLLLMASATSAEPVRPWAKLSPEQKEIVVNRVARSCKFPKAWFVIKAQGELHLRPTHDGKPSQVDCALRLLKPYAPFMGFVGNETYDPDIK